ncbi:MAG: hypothetical protein GY855_04540 [candidate division Zixibacteria bacterium]|nr:hypothetical protein [candidate division Zixibacteria bacterium]
MNIVNNSRFKTQADNAISSDNLIGLALSGGGIKSSAFHWGLLSGLHTVKYPAPTSLNLLNRMDYISSVSGGTWAASAYWTWPFYDDELFQCLDDIIANTESQGKQCNRTVNMLPIQHGKFYNRNQWREHITRHFLRWEDIKLSAVYSGKDTNCFIRKP